MVKALGETRAVIVGHDWGAPVAWHCALLRPDVFRAVACLSVPLDQAGAFGVVQVDAAVGGHDDGLAEGEFVGRDRGLLGRRLQAAAQQHQATQHRGTRQMH